jgi:hypothetical protein
MFMWYMRSFFCINLSGTIQYSTRWQSLAGKQQKQSSLFYIWNGCKFSTLISFHAGLFLLQRSPLVMTRNPMCTWRVGIKSLVEFSY